MFQKKLIMALQRKQYSMVFPKVNKYIILFFAVALLVAGARAYQLFQYIFKENVKKEYVLFIHEGDTYDQVLKTLTDNEVLYDLKAFKWVSKKKKYPAAVKPGRYLLKKGMNTNQVVNMLRAGVQDPVNVVFNNIRFKEQFAGAISKYLQADSLSLLALFSPETARKYGFLPENFSAMFIPNTYQFYWTTSATEFADRMKTEYDRFWNEARKTKAQQLGLTPPEVATLASIVQEETNKNDEKPIVAGVYLNRLKKGIPLQADPTVKFAVGDFAIQRVLNSHLETESPYNTYRYAGLPPGPISFAEISSIDAVLNYQKHNYLYFCAREDFSGYHNFARTLSEHNRNAEKYRSALNKLKIWK